MPGGTDAPAACPGPTSGVTDQSRTVAASVRRTACTAKRIVTSLPSAVVHTDSPTTGSRGSVGGGGPGTDGDGAGGTLGAGVVNSPGSCAPQLHAPVTRTATSRTAPVRSLVATPRA